MKTEELESRLRETLQAKARRITAADLSSRSLGQSDLPPRGPRLAPRLLTVAAAVAVIVGFVGVALTGQSSQPVVQPHIADQPAPPAATDRQRAWPLNGDEPLGDVPDGAASAASDREYALRSPQETARAYMTEVIRLPEDWPIETVEEEGDTAVAKYILQDVPSEITMARTADGFWYVTGASTDLARPGMPVPTSTGGLELSIPAGPRTYESGSPLLLTVLATNGDELLSVNGRVGNPPPDGQAGQAQVWSVEWAEPELAAAVRIDVLDDHDDDPSTPEATIGHWTTGLAPPALSGLPAGFDPLTAEPVFSAAGSADAVADAYMRERFPDHPNPGIELEPARSRGRRAYADWSTVDNGERIASGVLALRETDTGGWSVVAATTSGVDLSSVETTEGRVAGRVTTDNNNSLFADVFQPGETPAAGSPHPEGQPDAAYRFGTAGGPGDGSLDIDVRVEPGSAVLRVNLVGGTILSITELSLVIPSSA